MRFVSRPAIERFERMVERIPECGCWIWTGTVDRKGYGRFNDAAGRKWLSHRWAYTHFRGEIPDGLTIDHRCNTPSCVNPDHLAPATNRENTLRGPRTVAARNLASQSCPKGHSYIVTTEGGRQRRRCPVCQRAAVRDSMRRRRARNV